jgi:hypothetical protein
MADYPNPPQASTPDASAAAAMTRDAEVVASDQPAAQVSCPGLGTQFDVGPGLWRAVQGMPYERRDGDPIYRPLKIYTLDPTQSKLSGSVAIVNVPYEPLAPGPVGAVFAVDNFDGYRHLRCLDLDDPLALINSGRDPSPSDPRFHQQMVYAVSSLVYAAFRTALGRHIAWGFAGGEDTRRLLLRPYAHEQRNAYYDKQKGELCFGYYRALPQVTGRNLPGSVIFTSLSHDIIAHEVTHALLDGLRARFMFPSSPDVLAFHEAFADLVAIFQHFSYSEVVKAALGAAHGDLTRAGLLTDLAGQFGQTTGLKRALRSAVADQGQAAHVKLYGADDEPHALGTVLVLAVFEAFVTVFRRKMQRFVRLATGGTGVLPPGELPADLLDILASEASKLARQFLSICIRAIDYCPPLDLQFGEFLRAVITADYDLVPDDPWGYREAWIDAFERHKIYPQYVSNLSEDALRWRPPPKALANIEALSFGRLQFEGDPGSPAGINELRRQACALGEIISQDENLEIFGLTRADAAALRGDSVEPPRIESIRASRRVGPDGQIVFDLVAEVTQRRRVRRAGSEFDYYGGATIILGPKGEVRQVISKNVLSEERLERQLAFMQNAAGRAYWQVNGGTYAPAQQLFKLLHTAEQRNNVGAE